MAGIIIDEIFAKFTVNMKTAIRTLTFSLSFFLSIICSAQINFDDGALPVPSSLEPKDPWKKEQLIKPAELSVLINNASKHPVIINVGPMANIKGAIKVEPTKSDKGMEQLKAKLAGISKDTEVIIYCGCCTSENCPNIRPAFKLCKELGFKKARVLEIEHGFVEDWSGKGYPVE